MRRLIRFCSVMIFMLVVSNTVIYAQETGTTVTTTTTTEKTNKTKTGIRVGALSSKYIVDRDDFDEDISSKIGADLALVAEFPIGPIASLVPEFHWMQKGAKVEDLQGTAGEVVRTFNYFELPLLLKLHFGNESGFFIMAGPSFGYLFDGTDKDRDGSTSDVDLDFYKRGEIGAHVGGGVAVGVLRFDMRYIFGFTNIFNESPVANQDDEELNIKNTSIGAGVTIMF